MEVEERAKPYLEAACEYLGISINRVIKARVENDAALVVIYHPGPKVRVPLVELDAREEDDAPECEIDATPAALRLMEQHQIDRVDIVEFIGGQRRVTARSVRNYVKAMGQ